MRHLARCDHLLKLMRLKRIALISGRKKKLMDQDTIFCLMEIRNSIQKWRTSNWLEWDLARVTIINCLLDKSAACKWLQEKRENKANKATEMFRVKLHLARSQKRSPLPILLTGMFKRRYRLYSWHFQFSAIVILPAFQARANEWEKYYLLAQDTDNQQLA